MRALAADVGAGLVGTAAMGAFLAVERRLRGGRSQIGHALDYDASAAPLRAVRQVTGVSFTGYEGRELAWQVLHWGYGGGAATLRGALARRGVDEPTATLAFWTATAGGALLAFPLLRVAPPPWRWRPDVLASSLAAHAVYAVGTSAALRRLRPDSG